MEVVQEDIHNTRELPRDEIRWVKIDKLWIGFTYQRLFELVLYLFVLDFREQVDGLLLT